MPAEALVAWLVAPVLSLPIPHSGFGWGAPSGGAMPPAEQAEEQANGVAPDAIPETLGFAEPSVAAGGVPEVPPLVEPEAPLPPAPPAAGDGLGEAVAAPPIVELDFSAPEEAASEQAAEAAAPPAKAADDIPLPEIEIIDPVEIDLSGLAEPKGGEPAEPEPAREKLPPTGKGETDPAEPDPPGAAVRNLAEHLRSSRSSGARAPRPASAPASAPAPRRGGNAVAAPSGRPARRQRAPIFGRTPQPPPEAPTEVAARPNGAAPAAGADRQAAAEPRGLVAGQRNRRLFRRVALAAEIEVNGVAAKLLDLSMGGFAATGTPPLVAQTVLPITIRMTIDGIDIGTKMSARVVYTQLNRIGGRFVDLTASQTAFLRYVVTWRGQSVGAIGTTTLLDAITRWPEQRLLPGEVDPNAPKPRGFLSRWIARLLGRH